MSKYKYKAIECNYHLTHLMSMAIGDTFISLLENFCAHMAHV
jgi:hypothetical protein